jgi:hypothetical protein
MSVEKNKSGNHVATLIQKTQNAQVINNHYHTNGTSPPKKLSVGVIAALALCGITTVIIIIALASMGETKKEHTGFDYDYEKGRYDHFSNDIISIDEFISASEKFGYEILIEEDYDGFNTFWAGAHLFPDEYVERIHENRVYSICYTKDASIFNSRVEYVLWVDDVTAFGGRSNHAVCENGEWEWQVNSSESGFGIAYRILDVNLFVTAPPEYKDRIMLFFEAIGFGVDLGDE